MPCRRRHPHAALERAGCEAFGELRRAHPEKPSPFFYTKSGEIDVYLPEADTGIQVSLTAVPAPLERELNALDKLSGFRPSKKALIVTLDEEPWIEAEHRTIDAAPCRKWLLSFGRRPSSDE